MTKKSTTVGLALAVAAIWCATAAAAPSLIGPGQGVVGEPMRYRVFVDPFATYKLEWSGFADGSAPVTACTYPIVGCYIDTLAIRSERVKVVFTRTDLPEGSPGRTGTLPAVYTDVFSNAAEFPTTIGFLGKRILRSPGSVVVVSPRKRVALEWQAGSRSGDAQKIGVKKVAGGFFEHRFRLIAPRGKVILTALGTSPLRESQEVGEADRVVGRYKGPRYGYFRSAFDPGDDEGIAAPRLGLQFVATRSVRTRTTGALQQLVGAEWQTVQSTNSVSRRPGGRTWLQRIEAFDEVLRPTQVCTGAWRVVGTFRVTTPGGRNILPRRLRKPVVHNLSAADLQCTGRGPRTL